MIADKTGSLIATSARFGAMFGGATPALVEALTAYGEEIGVAFQLSDDLLDIVSQSASRARRPGTDLREGVATLPVLYALAGDDPAAVRLREILAAPAHRRRATPRRSALLRSSALSGPGPTRCSREYAERARARLAAVPAGDVRDALSALCDYMVTRTS